MFMIPQYSSQQPKFSAVILRPRPAKFCPPGQSQLEAVLTADTSLANDAIVIQTSSGRELTIASSPYVRQVTATLSTGHGIRVNPIKNFFAGFWGGKKNAELLASQEFRSIAQSLGCNNSSHLLRKIEGATSRIFVSREPAITTTSKHTSSEKSGGNTSLRRANDRQWRSHPLFGDD